MSRNVSRSAKVNGGYGRSTELVMHVTGTPIAVVFSGGYPAEGYGTPEPYTVAVFE
jgi:hypothetical protein